jgi:signal transduction histidine kinase
MRPYADGVMRPLESIRALHREEIRVAYRDIRRSVLLSDVIGVSLAMVFLAAFLALLAGIRRSVVTPVLGLHRAIEALRGGDLDARSPERGARELCEVAHAYNAMADTLAAQRDGQLTYLAGVAHDLRNPLGTMKMGVSLVASEEADERARHTLSLLDRQVDRMTRMVDDLLEVTRIEGGRLSIEPERFDLRERAREAVELHAPSFPAHDIVLAEADEPVEVWADPARIDQVLNNLLTNALKFSPGGSRVDVRVFARGGAAVIEVQDRGVGMTVEELGDLFAPFRRHAPTLAPGAGLGLSIVRRIVGAHGGTVEVESEPKVGSTFRVLLALAPDDEEDVRGGRPDRG